MNNITASGGLLPIGMSSGSARQVAANTRHHVEAWQEAWQALAPQDQATLTQAGQQAVRTLQSLTPAQQDALMQTAAHMADTLQEMTPDQRAQLAQQVQQSAQQVGSLTVAQRQAFLTRTAHSIEQTGSPFTPAQKAQFLSTYGKTLSL
jgi:TRAP-type C4-dicarboxylate transport system substrate-binding protein